MKKHVMKILVILIFAIIAIQTMSYATITQTPMYMGLVELRTINTPNWGYSIGNPSSGADQATAMKIWNFVQYSSRTSTDPTEGNFYCLKAGVGFTDTTGHPPYNVFFDMKTEKAQIKAQNDILAGLVEGTEIQLDDGSKVDRYSAILAMLDMFYLYDSTADNTSQKMQLLNSANIYENEWDDVLTEDEVRAVQQAALWYLTNYGEENGRYDKKDKTGWLYYVDDSGTYKNLADYNPTNTLPANSIGAQRQEQAEILYNYLIDTALSNVNTYESETAVVPAQVDTQTLDYEISGNNFVIGPIHITQNTNIQYNVNMIVKRAGNTITNYQLLDQNKSAVATGKTVKDLVGQDFYISVPIAEGEVSIDLDITYNKTKLTLWASTTNNAEQPIAIPEHEKITVPANLKVTPEVTEVTVNKQWVDNNNQDGLRTSEVEVVLVKNRQDTETRVKLNASNNWTHTFTNLPVKENGTAIEYSVREATVPEGYSANVTKNSENNYTITNTHTPEETELVVNKVWEDNDNQDGLRTGEVEVVLVKNGNDTETKAKLNASNNWTYTFENLPVKENGTEIEYSVRETTVPEGYRVSVTENSENNFTITNTHEPEVTEVTVNKQWVDNNNQDGLRTSEVEVVLVKNRQDTETKVKLNESNNWTHTFENLPVKENGTAIEYSVRETSVPEGYRVSVTENSENNYTITNTLIAEKTFDLALRKYIVSVDGTELTESNSRVPNIDESTIEGTMTATYKHKKNPVIVKTGSKVIYKLTIYNEGERDGRATKIIDQLPTGLKIVRVVSGNFELDSYSEEDNRLNLKRVAGNNENLSAYTAGNLDSETIEIECEVTAEATGEDKVLTNVAWISEEIDGATNEVITDEEGKDRDSEPSTAPDVNKDKMENYTGNGNKEDLSDSDYYYKGEQDDDDFEKLILVKAEGSYNIQILKVDSDDRNIVLSGAQFKITLSDGTEQTLTTNENGIIEIQGINITEKGTKTVTIEELTAPEDYEKIVGTLTLNITTGVVDGNFVVTNQTLTNQTNGATSSLEGNTIKVVVPNKEIEKPVDFKLIKRIVAVNNQNVPERIENVDVSKLNTTDENGKLITTGEYTLNKEPVRVKKGDIVTYTFRVYNEGMFGGYVQELTEDIPEGLEFIWSDKEGEELEADTTLTEAEKEAIKFNKQYRWGKFVYDENDEKIVQISSDYLAKENGDNLIPAFGENNGTKTEEDISYKEISVMLKVVAENITEEVIRNEAAITDDLDEDGEPTDDRDSKPEDWVKYEDDEDYDNIILEPFDLSLRKFIIAVSSDETIEDEEYLKNTDGTYAREPQVDTSKLNTLDDEGNIITTAEYNHTKEPLLVQKDSIIVYMLRVYNEGSIDGYAAEIKEHLPPHLEFIENEFNTKYGWEVSEDGRTVTTTYLEDELIAEPEIKEDDEIVLNYKEVPIMCKVKEKAPTSKYITNIADITLYEDDNKEEVEDRDSVQDNVELPEDAELPSYKQEEVGDYIPGQEDDDDFEKIVVKSFDLALRKWVTQAIVIENGETSVTNTGHQPYDDPEQIVKVELHRKKLNQVTVKFRYSIRVINEGELEGYAKEITDYIPAGLKFVAEDNKGWTDEGNNVISTRLLENKLLQPGEYADVEVVLTWVNNQDNMGVMVNTAEISEDYNEYGVPDKDSIPDNKKQGEDDIDDAPVMLSISTGQARIYFTLGFVILISIAGGVVLIKKFVL